MIYLDHNATTPLKPAVKTAMMLAMDHGGNASSVHAAGRRARRVIEQAREHVAALVGARPVQVVFTSGGTEANNLALRGCRRARALVSAVEHDSVLGAREDVRKIPVLSDGRVDPDALRAMLAESGADTLVSVMLVNNETGIIQPIQDIAEIAHKAGALLHTDAVQAVGRLPVDMAALGADLMTVSAHKIGGPQGCGALIVRENLPLDAALRGGGQEMRRRAGTENLVGIAGFGEAARLAANDLLSMPQLHIWRDAMERRIVDIMPDAIIVGAKTPRVATTSCIALPPIPHETQVMALDLAGIAVSGGAACSSGKVKASHVLHAMGFDDDVAGSAIRVSLGWSTKEGDPGRFVEAWSAFARRVKSVQQAA